MSMMRALSLAVLVLSASGLSRSVHAAEAVADGKLGEKLARIDGLAAHLAEKDGRFGWSDGKLVSLDVVDVGSDDQAIVETDGERISVPVAYIVEGRTDIAAQVPALAKAAKSGGVTGTLKLECTGLTGTILRGEQAIVMDGKVLKLQGAAASKPTDKPSDKPSERVSDKPTDRAKDRELLRAAADRFKPKLVALGMNAEARAATEDILARLSKDDGKEPVDEVAPAFARRLVRSGWLAQLSPAVDKASSDALKQAVLAAEKLQPVKSYAEAGASGTTLVELRDAFGHGGWTLATPTRCAYTMLEPDPMFMRPLALELVVDLPTKADPTTDADKATAARVCFHGRVVGSWDGKVFTADEAAWRQAVPEETRGSVAAHSLPAHLVLCALNGDRRKLIVAGGVVTAPRDATAAEASRFLGEAAKALPAPGDMDLVGEYFYRYVYDSPDPRFAMAVGNKQQKGDIHQTAAQTVGSVTGGMMRGDCDDIAELYQAIREKQGGYGHCVLLPGHTAFVWAVKDHDDWRANLLQTGPPMSYSAKTLPDALKQLYTSFDATAPFDPNGVGILLRFSGENTRGPWRLSWRIFAEPEYSKTMVEVQRDWQYQTYERGITTMKKMIEGGDKDPANYRELAGLASFTGQYALAAEWNQKAIDVTDDAVGKLTMTLEQVGHLHDAGDDDKARSLLTDVLDRQLPPLKEKLGAGVLQVGLEMAGVASRMKSVELATRALKETVLLPMSTVIKQLSAYVASPQFNQEAWDNATQLQTARRLAAEYVGVGMMVLKDIGKDAVAKDATLSLVLQGSGEWLSRIAFKDVDDQADVLSKYAMLGAMERFLLGDQELLARLEKAPFPASAKKDHVKRDALEDPKQLESDLSWIKLSVPFWFGQLSEQFAREKDALDRPLAKRLAKGFADAVAACKKLGIASPSMDEQQHLGAVIVAMLDQDAKVLRERLKFVAKENDKRLRDDTAQWLGDCARWSDDAWYEQVIQMWKEEVNYKPKWFWVAWRAALNKAPKLALAVAKRAAQEYKDDQSFTEEYDFMRQLLEGAKQEKQPEKLPEKTPAQ